MFCIMYCRKEKDDKNGVNKRRLLASNEGDAE